MAKTDYRRAFKIACELLNGACLYGIDSDRIFEIMMNRDSIVTNESYEEYILTHLQELDQGQYEAGNMGEIIENLESTLKILEQEPKTWSLDDAREDFVYDVYNTLDFLPTNNEANRIIDSFDRVTSGLKQQPEDAISRQAVLGKKELVELEDGQSFYCISPEDVETLPPVQPKYNTSEWCHDCSEYDQDKHCCPRFNKVIRNTVDEIKQAKTGQWIPVSERLPEEVGTYLVTFDYKENGNSIATLWYHGKQLGWDFRGADIVTAWMPLPEPYQKEAE